MRTKKNCLFYKADILGHPMWSDCQPLPSVLLCVYLRWQFHEINNKCVSCIKKGGGFHQPINFEMRNLKNKNNLAHLRVTKNGGYGDILNWRAAGWHWGSLNITLNLIRQERNEGRGVNLRVRLHDDVYPPRVYLTGRQRRDVPTHCLSFKRGALQV